MGVGTASVRLVKIVLARGKSKWGSLGTASYGYLAAIVLLSIAAGSAQAQTFVTKLWEDYDATAAPLAVEVVKEWGDDAGRYQLVRYQLGMQRGTNKTASPVIAAYYGYPKSASAVSQVPGIVHIHGGGQRANKGRVADWVKLGYAAISFNWGGRVLEQPDTPNTDWDGLAAGFERPGAGAADDLIHHNLVTGGPNTLFKEPHPLNSSWNLIAISARRALTFLEERPEVDGDRLGVEGHSMGGRSTVLTAIDPRVKAAAPSVGGSGYLYQDMWGLPNSARRMTKEEGLDLYQQTVSAQSYWPHIEAPVLFLQATNDFNAPTELVVKGMSLLPGKTERMMAMAPHLNHRFTTETAAARFLWMEAHLKGDFAFPKQSASKLVLDSQRRTPVFQVTVDQSSGLPIEKVEVYYGYARDPRVRFWRSAEVRRNGDIYTAHCPLFDVSEPVFAFANITYRLPHELPARPGAAATDRLTVSSQYQSAYPDSLRSSALVATETRQRTIDDFRNGWRDWYRLNHSNPHHWFYATRKIIDPTWMGPKGGKLALDVITSAANNHIAIGIEANTWQGYTGRKRDTFQAIIALPKAGINSITLTAGDFKNSTGQSMPGWDEATELTFTPANRVSSSTRENWRGKPPELRNLRWEGGDLVRRPYPHESRGNKRQAVAFDDEFERAIDDSVKLEQMDEQSVGPDAQGRVYLTKQMATSADSFHHVNNNKSWSDEPISVAGRVYPKGLGVHADSKLTYTLNGRFKSLHVVPGPDDGHRGKLEMKVLVDNHQVFTTGPTSSTAATNRKPIVVPLANARTLTLIVDSLGDRGGDHASWADAYLTRNESSTAQKHLRIQAGPFALSFNDSAALVSIKNGAGEELLSQGRTSGLLLRQVGQQPKRFTNVRSVGEATYEFAVRNSSEKLRMKISGTKRYLKIAFQSFSGFAHRGEKLYCRLFCKPFQLKGMEIDPMVGLVNRKDVIEVERLDLWETGRGNPEGSFVLYEACSPQQEDEIRLDVWTNESVPRPNAPGPWNRHAAEKWLDAWIATAYDTSYLNIDAKTCEELRAAIPWARKMDARMLSLFNDIWRGEYWLHTRQNHEINPEVFPGGLDEFVDFNRELVSEGLRLRLHYLSGSIGELDPEFVQPNVSKDLESWGPLRLVNNAGAGDRSLLVEASNDGPIPVHPPSPGVRHPYPVVPSFFDFRTFNLEGEWIQAGSLNSRKDGTIDLRNVRRGLWNSQAADHQSGATLRGYFRPYGQDFVPQIDSPVMETIAGRWADVQNRIRSPFSSFDGIEIHTLRGNWGREKFARMIYEKLDHPTVANTSHGRPPRAWFEYGFHRVQQRMGGPFQTREQIALFLADPSRAAPGMEEFDYHLQRFVLKNNRGFSLGSFDVKGVSVDTLKAHGLADELLPKIARVKQASFALRADDRAAMNTSSHRKHFPAALFGNHPWSDTLWRLEKGSFRPWRAITTEHFTDQWHFGQEHGTITPRFYLKTGQTLALTTPEGQGNRLAPVHRTRIVGRVLPGFDAKSPSNINLMAHLGSDSIVVSGRNDQEHPVLSDSRFTRYPIRPTLDLSTSRGIGCWVTGDGSGATLVIRLARGGTGRDYVVPIDFTGERWIEIPTGEQGWRVRDWGWTKGTRKSFDYSRVTELAIGLGHLPAGTSPRVQIRGLTALKEKRSPLLGPSLELGEQSVSLPPNLTIACEHHFILDPDGTFTVYDSNWNRLVQHRLQHGFQVRDGARIRVNSTTDQNRVWLEMGVQISEQR